MAAPSDMELVDLWATGNARAGRALFERHFATVFRYVRSRTSESIDDLVQQTFLACMESRDRYRGDASFQTFLLGIARHKVLAHHQRSRQYDVVKSSIPDPATSPSERLGKRRNEQLLLSAMERLPEELRQVLDLTYFSELDGPRIADVLGIPLNTVYSRLRRAKLQLRATFSESC